MAFTDRRLLDLYDPSNELLRVLREKAPGTFQHTLGVMELARNAAEAIGGDALLTQVGTYYHDIGKIMKPEYFVENMGEDRSVHDRLRPSMSKMIIISHVKDGIEFAREAGLPQKVIDMIPMHHGTTMVEYFYQKGFGYAAMMNTRAQTLGYGLADSPVFMAAFYLEKFSEWSHSGGDAERVLTRDEILDGISLYFDDHHMSVERARRIARRILQDANATQQSR